MEPELLDQIRGFRFLRRRQARGCVLHSFDVVGEGQERMIVEKTEGVGQDGAGPLRRRPGMQRQGFGLCEFGVGHCFHGSMAAG